MAKPDAQSAASPAVTLTPEALRQVIAQAIAEHDAQKAEQAKNDTIADMDRLCVRAFSKAGYTDIQPRQNVLTYNKWLEMGFKVRQGEASVKVKNLRLFHVSQVEKLNAVEAKKALAELEAKRAKRTSDVLPKPSPVEAPKPVGASSPKTAKVLIREPRTA